MAQGSGEKTEKASPKRKRDAREKGDVHKSQDLASALMMFFTFGTLKIGYDGFMTSMQKFMYNSLSSDVAEKAGTISSKMVMANYRDIIFTIVPMMLPLMVVVIVGSIMVHVLQTGPLLTLKKLKPDFKKINPISGFKRIFSRNTLVELVKSIIKIIIVAYIVFKQFGSALSNFSNYTYLSVPRAFSQIISTGISMGIMIAIALIAFSALDYLYQWWKFEKDLRMTKQEVKEESKQTEGDPQIKGKIKQQQRKMSAMRMMQRMNEADVVVTNPTHFAVALRYKENEDKAPVIIAKGQDHLAERIKTLAKKHKITIVENKPVARALYASCEVGDEVPAEMYQAIADILIYVYKTVKA